MGRDEGEIPTQQLITCQSKLSPDPVTLPDPSGPTWTELDLGQKLAHTDSNEGALKKLWEVPLSSAFPT